MMQKDEKALAWLNDNELCYNIWDKKYRYNGETFDEWLERVSAGNQEIAEMIKYKRFMFGGRTLANRGTGGKFSYSNCYSHGFIEDNMDDIMDAAKNLAMTYKRGGGQGLSLSKIRPKGSLIGGRYPSDGIIPFMELFNQVTATISQGGCIAKGEKVQLKRGLVNIEDVKIGDEAWTKLGYVKVNYKWNKGLKDVYEVKTKSGLKVRTTLDHKFNIDGFKGKALKDLKVGDNIVVIIGDSNVDNIFSPEFYTLGTFLANGTISSKYNSGNITFAKYVETGKSIVAEFIKSKTGEYPKISESDEYYRVYLNKKAIDSLDFPFKRTATVEIPDKVFRATKDEQISFIAGLIDTDGCVYDRSFKYDSISEKLIDQLVIILNSLGFKVSKSVQLRENRQNLYSVYVSIFDKDPNIPSFKIGKNIIGTVKNCRSTTPFTIDNLGIAKRTGHLKKLSKNSYIGFYTYLKECNKYTPCYFDEICSIEYCGESEVFDISLEEEHFFNCQGFYLSNSRKGALLMALDVKHPQIMDFIKIKETEGKITNANLSVEIDDVFMSAVVNNRTLQITNFGMEYEINPSEIFEEICKSAMKSAEPGVIFTDKFRNYNIMQYVDDYQIEICNPCGRLFAAR
jgi:intein/homing endonuclease